MDDRRRASARCHVLARLACNWIVHELSGLMNAASIASLDNSPVREKGRICDEEIAKSKKKKKVTSGQIGSIVDALDDGSVTGAVAKRVIRDMFERRNGETCAQVVERNQWKVKGLLSNFGGFLLTRVRLFEMCSCWKRLLVLW
jgi:Asp-tRNA(Asn)/Glu-tRNA(Gln) amidotransferase B subunit